LFLGYRLRMEEETALHFWHLVGQRFEVLEAVPDQELAAAMDIWGLRSKPVGVSVFRLKAVNGAVHHTSCSYCQRWLKPKIKCGPPSGR